MHLTPEDELSGQRFPEIGSPHRIFRDPGGRFIAVCSHTSHPYWAGRMAYQNQAPRWRVSLYHPDSHVRLATLDCRYPVNDLSFHPEKPEVAIASGTYDGGYYFDGELLNWDWETGVSYLLIPRAALRCRHDPGGGLLVLLRPGNEEQYEGRDPRDTFLGIRLDELGPENAKSHEELDQLEPTDPAEWGFDFQPHLHYPFSVIPQEELEELKSMGFEERQLVWDILWLDDRNFAAVHQNCHVEIHDLHAGLVASISGDGHGVELLPRAGGGFLVHVWHRSKQHPFAPDKSVLHLWNGKDLSLFREFDHACSFSTDVAGNILARCADSRARYKGKGKDQILDPSGRSTHEIDLGAFDCYNHTIRLNLGKELYYLRGTPQDSHEDKDLCAIDADGIIQVLFNWDDGVHHMADNVTAFVSDDELIRGCKIYLHGRKETDSRIERMRIRGGKPSWITPMTGNISALAVSEEQGIVAYAKADGILGLLSLETGSILFEERLVLDGFTVIATALAIRGSILLVGTHDGRLLRYQVRP